MNKNKVILNHCPNFYKIVNFAYFENDHITERLISIYESYIFNIDITKSEELKKVQDFDAALARYIDDYTFRKEMKYELMQIKVKKNEENLLDTLVLNIIRIFNRYNEGETKQIYISRWI